MRAADHFLSGLALLGRGAQSDPKFELINLKSSVFFPQKIVVKIAKLAKKKAKLTRNDQQTRGQFLETVRFEANQPTHTGAASGLFSDLNGAEP